MRKTTLLIIGIALAMLTVTFSLAPMANVEQVAETMFLTCEISESGVSIVEWKTVPGRIKRDRRIASPAQRFSYESKSQAGEVLWHGSFEDPRFRRIEAPDTAGHLDGQIVVRDKAQFTIRLPYSPAIQRLAFSKPTAPGALMKRAPFAEISMPPTREGRTP